jgi:SanA protein
VASGICYLSVEHSASPYIYDDIAKIPYSEVGLVLGTSKHLINGKPNPYLYNRLEAAKMLYFSGKVKYLLLSGDNHTIYYNEPRDMKKILVKMGVPSEVIVLDFAGFRTLDSVVRCNKVFGQQTFTVISQAFHNKRAIYLARNFGMDPIAFNAKDISLTVGVKVQAREVLARVKAVIDLHVTNAQPRFLGAQIQIAQK